MTGKEGAQLQPINLLAKDRRLWFWRIAVSGILVGLLLTIFGLSLLDTRLSLSRDIRSGLWLFLVGIALYLGIKRWREILKIFTLQEAACAIESAKPEVGQQLRTALEIASQVMPLQHRQGFRQRLISETELWLDDFDWRALVPRRIGRKWMAAIGLVLASILVAALLSPEIGLGLKRILLPTTGTTYTQLEWEDPPEWFDQRHPPLVRLRVSGRKKVPTLFVKEEGSEKWEEVALTPRENSLVWDAVLTGREKNMEMYAAAGDGISPHLQLLFEPIPELLEAKVQLIYPEYLGRKSETRSGGDVRAVEGTQVQWTFIFNTAPAEIEWAISGEGEPERLVSAETCLTSIHELSVGTRNPVLTVTDRRGRPVDSWRFESIGLVDNLPKIEILEPSKDRDATSITEIPVRIRATDDYGLGEVGIVLEAAGETRWVLEKIIDTSDQQQANEMVMAMLEEVPLEITDNVRLYAYALDRKPRGGPRALSHLRSIDIRQFKRRWKFGVLQPPPGGPKPKMEDIANLEKIITEQREIVSEVFVLKGGGIDSASQELFEKCGAEGALEDELALDVEALTAKWKEQGRIEADDIALLEVAGEQMTEAGKLLRVPKRDEAFETADSSLSNLLRLRKQLLTLILKADSSEGEPMDPKEKPLQLSKLADEARRLAREEADVRHQIEDEEAAKVTDPAVTGRQQEVAIFDAGELYSKLLTHPEKTEGALSLMDQAEKLMKEAGQKLQSDSDTGVVLSLATAEQRLLELAEFLTLLEMEMTSAALEEMAAKAEKEAEEMAKAESDSKGKGDSEQEPKEGNQENKKAKGDEVKDRDSKIAEGKAKTGKNAESQSGKGEGNSADGAGGDAEAGEKGDGDRKDNSKGKGQPDALAKAARRARLTDEILKSLAEREATRGDSSGDDQKPDDGGKGESDKNENGSARGKVEALADLRKELKMRVLAEALEKLAEAESGEEGPGKTTGSGNDEKGVSEKGDPRKELAERLGAAGGRMRQFAKELDASHLAQLADVKSEIEKLKQKLVGGEPGDQKKSPNDAKGGEGENPFAALNEKIGKGNGIESNAASESDKKKEGVPKTSDEKIVGGRSTEKLVSGHEAPTEGFTNKLNRLDDDSIRRWGRYLHDAPFDRNSLPILEAIEKRVDELVGEIPQISSVTGGPRTVPESSRREIEDYFSDLSDDFGEETWIKK